MTKPNPKEFGKQIASLRKAQGFSQADLADASGVSITAIRRCEQNGKIPLDRYLILASVLNANLKIVPSLPSAGSLSDRLLYRTIEDVIRSAEKNANTAHKSKHQEIRKPRLGGLFDRMKKENNPA